MEVIKKRKLVVCFALILLVLLVLALFLNSSSKNNSQRDTGTAGINVDNGDSKVNWSKYKTDFITLSSSVEIKESGIYYIYGELKDDSITVDVGDEGGVAKLILSGASINSEDGPAIYIKSADDVVIETEKGTKNFLTSGETYKDFGEDNVDGTIYSKGDLSFSGEGYLYVESKYQDAIVSKDDLTVRSGEIVVVSADDGIRGKDSVYIVDGNIKINAKQDGIKSTNEDDSTKGFVYIEDGEIEIYANDDGIHATSSLVIDNGKVNIVNSYEGLEGGKVVINDGEVNIKSNDDGINIAGGKDESAFMRPGAQNFSDNVNYTLTINGGSVYVNSGGDGLDSNGTIYINGGEVVVDGPTNSANGALDSELGIYINGGSVIAVGASGMAESFNESSMVFGVSVYLDTALVKGTVISIRDKNDSEIISYVSAKTFNHVAVGSEEFQLGETYNIYIDDEKYDSFTISQVLTTVGNATNDVNGGPNGDGMNGGPMNNGREMMKPNQN